MDCYILHTVLLLIIVLIIIAIICYNHEKRISKTKKHIAVLTIQKWRIYKFLKVPIKNCI